ncbi:MAG: hypothetical protein MUD08_05820 [Cytophagales bacterium]|nr:hypothetical protein [Cytophagales bacterium]
MTKQGDLLFFDQNADDFSEYILFHCFNVRYLQQVKIIEGDADIRHFLLPKKFKRLFELIFRSREEWIFERGACQANRLPRLVGAAAEKPPSQAGKLTQTASKLTGVAF